MRDWAAVLPGSPACTCTVSPAVRAACTVARSDTRPYRDPYYSLESHVGAALDSDSPLTTPAL
jgi:hypothetical protein